MDEREIIIQLSGWILDLVNISFIFYQLVTCLFCQKDFFVCPKHVSVEVTMLELYVLHTILQRKAEGRVLRRS